MENSSVTEPENDENDEKDKFYGVGGFVLEIVKIFVMAVIIVTPIRVFLFQPFFVQGASMEPNFLDGEYLIVNELGYKMTEVGLGSLHMFSVGSFRELQRGDVVVFRYPNDTRQFFIKRIVGMPGEKMSLKGGKVKVYNKENPEGLVLNETEYLDKDVFTNGQNELTLAEDEYFVMGDNRNFSHDSRSWGPLKQKYIMGRVLLRAWPIAKADIY